VVYAVQLDDLTLDSHMSAVYESYKSFAAKGIVGQNHIRIQDYLRWQSVLNVLVEDAGSFCDVGCGVGQFANALSEKRLNASITAADMSKNSRLKNLNGFEFLSVDLAKQNVYPQFDVVTCLETIEHIDAGFDLAISNLRAMSKRQLVISVPYREKKPMISGHFQWFDLDRIRSLFPNASISILVLGRSAEWALIDERHE